MKKHNSMKLLIPAAAIMLCLFSSCEKREYTCFCKMSNGTTSELPLGRLSNNKAQKKCNDHQLELTEQAAGYGVASQCKVIW